MAKRFVESPECKLYFWLRYRKLVPIMLACLILVVGLIGVGCSSDSSRSVQPMGAGVQAAAVPDGEASASVAALVGREYRHLHVPLVRITVIGVQDGAVITDIRVNGSHQIKASIESNAFTSALVDYEDITGAVVDQADPAVF